MNRDYRTDERKRYPPLVAGKTERLTPDIGKTGQVGRLRGVQSFIKGQQCSPVLRDNYSSASDKRTNLSP